MFVRECLFDSICSCLALIVWLVSNIRSDQYLFVGGYSVFVGGYKEQEVFLVFSMAYGLVVMAV